MAYEVQTLFTYGWENCWTECDTGTPLQFDTREAAQAEIDDVLTEGEAAGMDYSADDFRIIEVA